MKTDFLVIGSGIAGLTFALKVANHLPSASVTIITKSDESESNTKYAQGGIAAALNDETDSLKKHIDDTLKAGDGLCDKKVVEIVVKEGVHRLKEIIKWGAEFDKNPQGDFDLGKEGGHSEHRIVHHKDITGLEVERKLLAQIHKLSNVKIITHAYSIDLITEHHIGNRIGKKINCYGVYFLNKKKNTIEKIESGITLLATGGIGQVYRNTTNPLIATGDGIAMAHRAGAKITNMEFVQFHPTALYNPSESPSFLISEAVRGHGAILRNKNGERFMFKYDKRGELASRDIVARAIDSEMKKHGDDFVYLTHLHSFKKHFPNIWEKCKRLGINTKMIPVVPAAHYLCGGIKTDIHGKTSINRLYACGECADTGLHGANRLASNSLLEAMVFAHRCYLSSVKNFRHKEVKIPGWNAKGTTKPKEHVQITHCRAELQMLMSNYLGMVRSDTRLKLAMKRMKMLESEIILLYKNSALSPQLCELRNLISVAKLITENSLSRKENRGVFYKIAR